MSDQILLDLISIVIDHAQALFGVLLITVTGYALIVRVLKMIFKDRLTRSEYFSLGLGGWLLPVSLLAWLAFFAGSGIESQLLPILLPIICLLSIFFLLRFKPDPSTGSGQRLQSAPQPIDLLLPLILVITIPLRLLLVKDAVLPSYFDSVEHYIRIQNILNPESATPFLSQLYYHVGYHIVTAFTVAAAKAPIGATMLIIGQWLLATMPISVFFLIRHSTRSNTAGLFAVVLSALGWYMPTHAVDWGKYPALMSLGLIPFVMSLAYLYVQDRSLTATRRWALAGLLILSIAISTLLHSRSLIIYVLVMIVWLLAGWIEKLSTPIKITLLILVTLGIAIEGWLILQQPLFTLLFDPYLNAGILITIPVLLLAIFAWKANSQLATACLLLIAFLCGSIYIPVKGLGGYPDLTLLDRPFVEMILYLPLALLGGLGLAGLLTIPFERFAWQQWIGGVLIIGVLLHAFTHYSFQLSPCCILIGNDDVAAIAWMNLHIPKDTHVGVAATGMDVIVSDRFEGLTGSDAGIWIAPLIKRAAILLPYDTDFDQQSALNQICALKINYLYVGEEGNTFNRDLLSQRPEWYTNLLAMPVVQVYEVTGCNH